VRTTRNDATPRTPCNCQEAIEENKRQRDTTSTHFTFCWRVSRDMPTMLDRAPGLRWRKTQRNRGLRLKVNFRDEKQRRWMGGQDRRRELTELSGKHKRRTLERKERWKESDAEGYIGGMYSWGRRRTSPGGPVRRGQRRIVGHSQKELWVGRCLAEPSGEGEISHDGRRPARKAWRLR